jgi:hypothetical protein
MRVGAAELTAVCSWPGELGQREVLIRLTGQQIPLSPQVGNKLLKVALRLLTNCFQFLLPKENFANRV